MIGETPDGPDGSGDQSSPDPCREPLLSEFITPAQYTSVAKELLASSASMLAAERRSYASIEQDYTLSTGTDPYAHFAGVADALDALAVQLRS